MTIYADALAALVALSLFLLFFYGPWQVIVVDIARQFAFEQRDAVFDMAAEGKLDFQSAEYKTIRDSFNKLIRFSHEMNWVRLVIHWDADKAVSDVHLAIDRIEDPETRAKISSRLRKTRLVMIAMVGAKSLPLLVAAIAVTLITWCMGTTRDFLLRMEGVVGEKMQVEAEGA